MLLRAIEFSIMVFAGTLVVSFAIAGLIKAIASIIQRGDHKASQPPKPAAGKGGA